MLRTVHWGAAAAILAASALASPTKSDPMPPDNQSPEKPAAAPAAAPQAAQAPAAPPAAPTTPPMEDPRDRELRELRKIIDQLQKRVEDLEKKPEPMPPPPDAPPPDPAPLPPTGQGTATGAGGATFLPNISVIGNLVARGGDSRAIPGRGRSHFEELEIAFQDQVAPKLRYDVFFSAEKEENWQVGMEEGYLTATGVFPGLNIRAGRLFTPIGKFNPQHPHQWLFISRPSASQALLGDHGLSSDGAVATYVLPVKAKGLYAGLDFGLWRTAPFHVEEHEEHEGEEEEEEDHHEHEGGFQGGANGAYSARLHLSKALSLTKELEFGATRYWGRGEVEDFGQRMMAINGIDLTYRSYPDAFKRVWLTAELLAHETQDIGGDAKYRLGGWFTAAYRWNQYWEAGFRADYTRFPFPNDGYEVGGSLFLTKYITEQTSLRLEYRHAKDNEFGHSNGIFFQLLFGSGPHAHPLQ